MLKHEPRHPPHEYRDYEAVLRLWQQSEGEGLNESDEREAITSFLARNPCLSRVAV